jgi:hypothetical protein
VLLGDGDGGFTVPDFRERRRTPWQTVVGDFNKDGNVDVASCNSNVNNVGISTQWCPAVSPARCRRSTAIRTAGDRYVATSTATARPRAGDQHYVAGDLEHLQLQLRTNVFGSKKTLSASTSGIVRAPPRYATTTVTSTSPVVDETDDWLYFFRTRDRRAIDGPTPRPGSVVSMLQNSPNPFQSHDGRSASSSPAARRST